MTNIHLNQVILTKLDLNSKNSEYRHKGWRIPLEANAQVSHPPKQT